LLSVTKKDFLEIGRDSLELARQAVAIMPRAGARIILGIGRACPRHPYNANNPKTVVRRLIPGQSSFLFIPRSLIVSDKIVHVTDSDFDQVVLKADGPVLVDYWAEWCGPCKMIEPILHELADEYGDKIRIAKVNIDENQQVTTRYKIRGIPTLMIFENGEHQATKVGALTKSALKAFVDDTI
jgi:thioredoxin 1